MRLFVVLLPKREAGTDYQLTANTKNTYEMNVFRDRKLLINLIALD